MLMARTNHLLTWSFVIASYLSLDYWQMEILPQKSKGLSLEARHTKSLEVSKQRRLKAAKSIFLPSKTFVERLCTLDRNRAKNNYNETPCNNQTPLERNTPESDDITMNNAQMDNVSPNPTEIKQLLPDSTNNIEDIKEVVASSDNTHEEMTISNNEIIISNQPNMRISIDLNSISHIQDSNNCQNSNGNTQKPKAKRCPVTKRAPTRKGPRVTNVKPNQQHTDRLLAIPANQNTMDLRHFGSNGYLPPTPLIEISSDEESTSKKSILRPDRPFLMEQPTMNSQRIQQGSRLPTSIMQYTQHQPEIYPKLPYQPTFTNSPFDMYSDFTDRYLNPYRQQYNLPNFMNFDPRYRSYDNFQKPQIENYTNPMPMASQQVPPIPPFPSFYPAIDKYNKYLNHHFLQQQLLNWTVAQDKRSFYERLHDFWRSELKREFQTALSSGQGSWFSNNFPPEFAYNNVKIEDPKSYTSNATRFTHPRMDYGSGISGQSTPLPSRLYGMSHIPSSPYGPQSRSNVQPSLTKMPNEFIHSNGRDISNSYTAPYPQNIQHDANDFGFYNTAQGAGFYTKATPYTDMRNYRLPMTENLRERPYPKRVSREFNSGEN